MVIIRYFQCRGPTANEHGWPNREFVDMSTVSYLDSAFLFRQQLLGSEFVADVYTWSAPAAGRVRVKVLGVVEAGWPSPAEEELLDAMSFDDYLVSNKDASYILRVKGNSMIDARIHPGDMVLVERTRTPRDGDIVISEIDDEWTMKRFRQQGQRVWLEAANAAYPPISPQRELTIVAVVCAVVRKYT